MGAGTYTLEIDQGLPSKWLLTLSADDDGTPADLTDCTIASAIRPYAGQTPKVDLPVTILDPMAGEIEIEVPDTSGVLDPTRAYAWDMVLTDADGHPSVILRGPVLIKGVITLS